jgi:hypothetical protein
MSDRCTITMPDDSYAAVLDALQRAVIDKCASKVTRKVAFSALLALVEAGVVAGETSVSLTARDMSASGLNACQNAEAHGLILQGATGLPLGADRRLPGPMPSVLATCSLISFAYLDRLYRGVAARVGTGKRLVAYPLSGIGPQSGENRMLADILKVTEKQRAE